MNEVTRDILKAEARSLIMSIFNEFHKGCGPDQWGHSMYHTMSLIAEVHQTIRKEMTQEEMNRRSK